MKTREVEIRFSDERIIQAVVLEDGSCKLVVETMSKECEVIETIEKPEDVFILVEASKLSLNDKFMKHRPKTKREREFKELLTKVIQKGIKDFYKPKYDPSFNDEGNGVCFKANEKPAVGNSYNWWKEVAKKFMPERHSRLGTRSEYVAFLGVLIKQLVEDGWSVKEAWDRVCNDSRRLGHYWNSTYAKRDYEDTGKRLICGFYDLANTRKILAEDEDEDVCTGGFWLAGGYFNDYSNNRPLVEYDMYTNCNLVISFSVGWFVLS